MDEDALRQLPARWRARADQQGLAALRQVADELEQALSYRAVSGYAWEPRDMHLVTKRWVAEALTAMASAPGVGYWLTAECLDPVASVPLLRIFLLLDNASSGYGIPWPPDQRRVKLSVRRALDDLGVLKPEFALNEHRN